MKSIRNMCSNIAWICKPYKKYGLYLLLSIVIMGLYSPIEDFLYVYTPEIILNMLADEKPFHIVAAADVDKGLRQLRFSEQRYFQARAGILCKAENFYQPSG